MDKEKYYFIKGKNKAITISYLLCEDFKIVDDRFDSNNKFYVFKKSNRLFEVMSKMKNIKNESSSL
ncbi:hypothetical protein [Clostridium sp.]|uniref:DUF5659 domain-containing protein n=1 Tax=Clostridium butyricum TaxID=1492 RepID=A0A6N3FFG4_CLOBU|nr:hypothetical protein [Clostridium sp.]MDU7260710.1 hypothetical protein [Clostridium butyricum]DAT56669.1 MAG TPA: hypothetical protein [Caudoviricetes sp.]MDU1068162.1 hypothetical protein [Clostridium sp.]MDU1603533.1 hypothetical protein [Clostridium sp.]MDU2679736.1 hypothetical protein [Clostridium sp.]